MDDFITPEKAPNCFTFTTELQYHIRFGIPQMLNVHRWGEVKRPKSRIQTSEVGVIVLRTKRQTCNGKNGYPTGSLQKLTLKERFLWTTTACICSSFQKVCCTSSYPHFDASCEKENTWTKTTIYYIYIRLFNRSLSPPRTTKHCFFSSSDHLKYDWIGKGRAFNDHTCSLLSHRNSTHGTPSAPALLKPLAIAEFLTSSDFGSQQPAVLYTQPTDLGLCGHYETHTIHVW